MPRVLFLCTGNAARSQMAEALYRKFSPDDEIVSAGARPFGYVLPEAIAVMKEIGIDISKHESKSVEPFLKEKFDLVVTVCSSAAKACPSFPHAQRVVHWDILDPHGGSIHTFRAVRDDLQQRIEDLLKK